MVQFFDDRDTRLQQAADEREARREQATAEREARREAQHAAQLAALRGSPSQGGAGRCPGPGPILPGEGVLPFSRCQKVGRRLFSCYEARRRFCHCRAKLQGGQLLLIRCHRLGGWCCLVDVLLGMLSAAGDRMGWSFPRHQGSPASEAGESRMSSAFALVARRHLTLPKGPWSSLSSLHLS